MSDGVAVFVTDQDNPEYGRINRFASLELAERFVEAQIQDGTAVETLKVFTVSEIPLAVSYRPVVSLAPESGAVEAPAEGAVEATPYERDGQRLSSVLPRDDA
jgi:hypothetical protein